MTPKRFTVLLICSCLAVAAVAAALNWRLDPTGLLNVAGIRTAQACAPGLRGDDIDIKATAAYFARAKTLFVGTSQVARGLDPDTLPADWPGGAFNLGIRGTNIGTLKRVLPQAIHDGHTERIVLGMGLNMMRRRSIGGDGLEMLPNRTLKLLVTAVLSHQATRESLRMLASTAGCNKPEYRLNGFDQSTPVRFVKRMEDRFRLRVERELRPDMPTYDRQHLETLFGELCGRRVKVIVAILPNSIDWQFIYWKAPGGWDAIERFKRDIVEAAGTLGRAGCPTPIHDFNLVEIATAAGSFAGPGPTPFMDYVHFTPVLGRKLLQELAGAETAGADAATGRRLDAQNISAHLAAERARMQERAGQRR